LYQKVPKIKKILVYEIKFLVPNYSCLQNPWLGGYRPQIPTLSVLNWICWTPPPVQNSWVRQCLEGPEREIIWKTPYMNGKRVGRTLRLVQFVSFLKSSPSHLSCSWATCLTRSGLTYSEVSSKVYHDSFCQLGSSVSLPWVIYFVAFCLHVSKYFTRLYCFTYFFFIYCSWVVNRWQWLFYMCTKHEIGYY